MPNYLIHYGILGQKWGDRNGPPYPLGSEQKSKSEKARKRFSHNRNKFFGSSTKQIIEESNKRRDQIIKNYEEEERRKLDARKMAADNLAKNDSYASILEKTKKLSSEGPNSDDPDDWKEWVTSTDSGKRYLEMSDQLMGMYTDEVNRILDSNRRR